MGRSLLKNIGLAWAIVLALFILGMLFAQCIPVSWISTNALKSSDENAVDALADASADPTEWVSADTVAVMLSMATHKEGTIPESAMSGSYYWPAGAGTSDVVSQGLDKPADCNYEWYWHGWMVVLKPLLILFDYIAIKKLFSAFFVVLFCLIAYRLQVAFRARGLMYAAALGVSLVVTNSFAAVGILPYSFSLIVAFVGVLLVFYDDKKHSCNQVGFAAVLFFVLGAVATYFDFLITPAITFALPLAFYALLKGKEADGNGLSVGSMMKRVFLFTLLWIAGYALLLLSKWVVASFVLGSDIVSKGLNQVFFRMGVSGVADNRSAVVVDQWHGVDVNFLEAIRLNAGAIFQPVSLWAVAAFLIAVCVISLIARRENASLGTILALGVVAAVPYIWYAVLDNHSIIHYYFTCRLQLATLFAIAAMPVYALDWKRFFQRKAIVRHHRFSGEELGQKHS